MPDMSITFTVQHTDGRQVRLVLGNERICIGRNPESQVSFEDEGNQSVSWDHAAIVMGSPPVLEDLGSTNGTFVNGERLSSAVPLSAGDLVQLGGEGPTLVVNEVAGAAVKDNAAAPVSAVPAPAGATGQISPLIGWIVGAGLAAILGLAAYAMMGGTRADKEVAQRQTAQIAGASVQPAAPEPTATRSPPDPPPKPKPDPPKLEPLSPEQIREEFAPAMVWCGVTVFDPKEGHELHFPYCTGWLIDKNTVVVNAERIHHFEAMKKVSGEPPFVCDRSLQFHDLTRWDFHPLYEQDDPVSGQSLLHYVGVCQFDGGSGKHIPAAELQPSLQSPKGTTIYVLAFAIPDSKPKKQWDRFSTPELKVITSSVTDSETFPNKTDAAPLLITDVPPPNERIRLDGGLVVDRFGTVLGSLLRHTDRYRVLLVDNMTDIIPSE